MNPSFKDIAAFRATAPTPTDAMRVMLGHESSHTYVPTFLEVIPLVLGAPYSPPPFAYHSIEHAVDLPPRIQETISKLGFRRPSDIYAWLASVDGPQQLDASMKRIAEEYLENLLSNHHGTLRFVIEEINRLRVSAMRSPEVPYTSNARRLTSLLFHIDERDLRGALDGVCMVHDALLWMKIQYPWSWVGG
ncbi:hypothetical protein FA13DRAFT_876013 [Coprinellus micaceus]|uniref:Uncharacterized protein n=1 Tax=Coprinellus micaceus TaxID=71717 RepID=A0A4Y7T0F6_COPMI|nr:hypothetical protein FA13DRAFT_876013 [Coprinellus micaceus]